MIWFQALVVSIQSFVSGFATSSLNSCLKETATGSILNDLPMTNSQQQIATAVTTGTALISSLLMSYPVKSYGYKPNILFGAVLTILAGLFCVFAAEGFEFLVIGRAILGWGVGLNSMTAPVLLSEIAPASIRGKVTAMHQLMITIGIFIAGALAFGFVENLEHGWKYVLSAPIALGVLNLVLFWALPESPVWLIRSGNEGLARQTLQKLRYSPEELQQVKGHDVSSSGLMNLNQEILENGAGDIASSSSHALDLVYGDNADASQAGIGGADVVLTSEQLVEQEIASIYAEIRQEEEITSASWADVFMSGRIFWIGLGIQFFLPLSGINAIMFYSTKIFGFAGVEQDIVATMLVGALNVFMTVVCMYTVEKAGRKTLITAGTAVCAVSLAALGAVLLGLNDHKSLQGYIAVALTLIYVAGFAIGLGAVGWIIMAEVTPARIRSKSYSLFISENWGINLFIGLFSLSVIEALGGGDSDAQQKKGVAYLFFIFAGFCLAAVIFMMRIVPETKGLTSEEIAALMSSKSSQNVGDDEHDFASQVSGGPDHGDASMIHVDQHGLDEAEPRKRNSPTVRYSKDDFPYAEGVDDSKTESLLDKE